MSSGLVYGVIGAGAVGGYYGGKLAASGGDVHFLYRSEYDVVRRRGLRIRSAGEVLTIRVCAYDKPEDLPPLDCLIIALKATSNPALEDLLPRLRRVPRMVVTLQNGLGNEEFLAGFFGEERIVAGTAFICSERTAPGEVTHFSAGTLRLAPFRSATFREREILESTASDFRRAGVETLLDEDGPRIKWLKLIWNIPFSGLAVFYGGITTDQILAVPERLALARELMEEIVAGARLYGIEISEKAIEKNIEATYPMGAYRPSMLVDFLNNRPMEIEAIVGEPLRRIKARGGTCTALERLYRGLVERAKESEVGRLSR